MFTGAMAESADAVDLKSTGGDTMWVRPPLAPSILMLILYRGLVEPPSFIPHCDGALKL